MFCEKYSFINLYLKCQLITSVPKTILVGVLNEIHIFGKTQLHRCVKKTWRFLVFTNWTWEEMVASLKKGERKKERKERETFVVFIPRTVGVDSSYKISSLDFSWKSVALGISKLMQPSTGLDVVWCPCNDKCFWLNGWRYNIYLPLSLSSLGWFVHYCLSKRRWICKGVACVRWKNPVLAKLKKL